LKPPLGFGWLSSVEANISGSCTGWGAVLGVVTIGVSGCTRTVSVCWRGAV
jgi:hypothetical protein